MPLSFYPHVIRILSADIMQPWRKTAGPQTQLASSGSASQQSRAYRLEVSRPEWSPKWTGSARRGRSEMRVKDYVGKLEI